MSKKGAFKKLAALGAAIACVVFFWRNRHPQEGPSTPPTASDTT